jgi:hypothetical protein
MPKTDRTSKTAPNIHRTTVVNSIGSASFLGLPLGKNMFSTFFIDGSER